MRALSVVVRLVAQSWLIGVLGLFAKELAGDGYELHGGVGVRQLQTGHAVKVHLAASS